MAQADSLASDDFPARLSLALQSCNLSRTQLSSVLGVHKSLVSRWLSGEMKPTSYNLARISTEIAQRKPGFNMTLWNASQSEFEAMLGLGGSAGVSRALDLPVGSQPARSYWPRLHWAQGVFGIAILLVIGGLALWEGKNRAVERNEANGAANQSAFAVSVAVMPFLNMSGDPTKEYLGDGVSEEILNDLSNVPNLHVAARTSSFSFKGKNAGIDEIAHKLNVQTIVEGSVRQQGTRLRIVAQLINAADGFHLWSASYDRNVNDILGMQDEIARAIVGALVQKLLPHGKVAIAYRVTGRQRLNPDAYNLYLQGRFSMNRSGAEDLVRAADLFKQAIRLQPDYVEAHASLALTYAVLYSNGERRDTLGGAKQEAATALHLDPDNFSALLADAKVKLLSWNWRGADVAITKLLRQYPNNPEAHNFHATLLEGVGLWGKAANEHRRAAELDPLVPSYRDNVGQALHFLRRDTEALTEFRRVLTIEPNFVLALGDICVHYADAGNLAAAREILHERLLPLYADDPNTVMCAATVAYRAHDVPALQISCRSAQKLYDRGVLAAGWLPFPYAFLGDYDVAIHWLEKAYDERDYGVFYAVREPDLPDGVKASARWKALLQRPAFRDIARVRAEILARDG